LDNPNIEWQEFGPSNWVAKWIGRNADLAPIVWVASPEISIPTSKQAANWSMPPFAGHLTDTHIYGQGVQGGKTAMIAMLEVLQALVAQEQLPDRTIYMAFPFPAQAGEAQILKALAQAGTTPEYMLQTGGLIAQDLLWELDAPVAFIGIGQLAQAKISLIKKQSTVDWSNFLNQLEEQLPAVEVEQAAAQHLLQQLSPELPFTKRFVTSNSWLLQWNKSTYFGSHTLAKQLAGTSIQLIPAFTDADTVVLKVTAPQLTTSTLNAIASLINSDSIMVVGDWNVWSHQTTADAGSRSYRLLANTCKEVFPNLLTAPAWIDRKQPPCVSNIPTPIFYFQPIVQDSASWPKAQLGMEESISRSNYQQLLQFYHRLLTNSI
jgi:carboxypeptidase PM20D1